MLQTREIVPVVSFNAALSNQLQEDIRRIVYSFNCSLNLFLTSKYNVQNYHIYPNSVKYDVFAFILILCMNAIYIYQIHIAEFPLLKNNLELGLFSFFVVINYMAYSIGVTMMFILDIVHKKNNVLLILKIQTIHRSIDFNKSIQSYIIWNWISLATIIFINVFVDVMFYKTYDDYDIILIFDVICDVTWITLDINFCYTNPNYNIVKKISRRMD